MTQDDEQLALPKSETPETDKAEIRFFICCGDENKTSIPIDGRWTHSDFARKLERERDALLNAAKDTSALLHMWDDGLDEQDGIDYEIAVKAWYDYLPRLDALIASIEAKGTKSKTTPTSCLTVTEKQD